MRLLTVSFAGCTPTTVSPTPQQAFDELAEFMPGTLAMFLKGRAHGVMGHQGLLASSVSDDVAGLPS